MAAPKKDPLDVLQLMVNDVLVQTGKALRVSRKDGKGNAAQPHGAVQPKLPDTLSTFHSALDELESDIVRAKSVLLRDLNQLQVQKAPTEPPQPIESQSRQPMVIDLESSPPPLDSSSVVKAEPKPMAPFPDMGTGLPDASQPDIMMKEEPSATKKEASAAPGGPEVKTDPAAAPAGLMPEKPPVDGSATASVLDGAPGTPPAALAQASNFTDMQFDLAPANDDAQLQSNTQEPSFDLTNFTSADGNNDMIDLDSFLPTEFSDQANPPAASTQTAANDSQPKPEQKQGEDSNTSFDAMFNADGSPADGMDFDFGLDNGAMGEDTFDDLIQDRDGNYGTMEHGDFDATFFGLDPPNNT